MNRSIIHNRLTTPSINRTITHNRLTTPPREDESLEMVLEAALLRLWEMQITEQIIWLDELNYNTIDEKITIKQLHNMLSPQAIEFISLLLHDCKNTELTIRTTKAPRCNYTPKGTGHGKISKKRFINFLRNHMGIPKIKAENVADELDEFVTLLLQNNINI